LRISLRSLLSRGRDNQSDASETAPAPPAIAPAEFTPMVRPVRRDDRFPRFKNVTAVRRDSDEPGEVTRARTKLRDAFTPAQPVTDRRLFAGRIEVLAHLIEVIENRLAHVVIFGERGIGKTSLLHILADLARESDYLTLRATCGAGSQFDVLFRTLLRDIPLLYHESVSPTDAGNGATLASLLPDRPFDARELADILSGVTSARILLMLDEYDRVESEALRLNIAELIKNLSDRAAPVQLVIAGVSSNLHELIGYIPSIRRNVVGVPLPKLSAGEVGEIIRRGEEASGISFAPEMVALVAELSRGSPYLVRLVCYHSSLAALSAGRTEVQRDDIRDGLDLMVEEAAARLPLAALQSARRIDWTRNAELLGCAVHLAGTPSGWFSATDIETEAGSPDKAARIEAFLQGELATIGLMVKEGGGHDARYRFVDEGLQSFLWITLARNRLLGGG
jgi:hypothetical protein